MPQSSGQQDEWEACMWDNTKMPQCYRPALHQRRTPDYFYSDVLYATPRVKLHEINFFVDAMTDTEEKVYTAFIMHRFPADDLFEDSIKWLSS